MNIGKFSVHNPVLMNILMAVILVLGIVAFLRLPRALESDISFSWVFISVAYPGVSAEEIEKNITIKIEEEIEDVDRIKEISSTTREGVSFVQVKFEDDISEDDFRRLYQDLRAEFDKVELPEDALEPWIDDFSTSDFMSIINVILTGDVDDAIINKQALELQDRLLDINDVSKAEIVGGREREVWINVDRDKIDAWGISLDQISNAIKYRNMNIPGGTLETDTREFIVQTLGQTKDIKNFGNVIVRRQPGKSSIKVSDVASVGGGFAKSSYDVRFNGEKAISLVISKKSKGNAIKTVNDVRKVVKDFEKTLPPGLSIKLSNDTTFLIRDILQTLGWNSVAGFITVVIILFLFMGLRNSIITALGIPVTFAATFIFMEWYGETLNGNSLFALVLVLGMIVDHAIVIMENCYRYRQQGMSAYDAAINGTNEVIKPVLSGTATTVAAFLPLMLLPGIMGKFMRIIPIVVTLALIASTLEALFILPAHMADWGGKARGNGPFMRWLIPIFTKLLKSLYKHRYISMLGTIGLIILSFMAYPLIKQDLFAGEEWTQFFVNIKLPVGTPREVTNKVASRFEDKLLSLVGKGEVVSLTSTVGFLQSDDEWLTQSNVAQITVDINEKKEGRTRSLDEIIADMKKITSEIPGAEIVTFNKLSNGPPVDKPVSFRIRGDEYTDMASISNDLKRVLAEYPELYNIDDNYDPGPPELRVNIDEERAADLGLNIGLVGLYIRGAFDGIRSTTYYDQDEEIDVIVRYDEKHRLTEDDLLFMKIATSDGRSIPFSSIATIERTTGMGVIKRTDLKREINVFADAHDKRNLKSITERIKNEFETKFSTNYPEISLKFGGEFEEFGKVLGDVLQLFWIGLFLIYTILGAQFKSFAQPFLIIFALPLAAIGCIWFLVITQTPFSIVVMYAGVALAGICVNDSIVLVSFINELRRNGTETADAVLEAAKTRIRPIILTSVTTIAGLASMALGIGGKSETWAPMAGTIVIGLIFSTVGTLLVIPCAYGILDDITRKLGFKMRLEGE